MILPVPVDARRTDWPRLVANAVNAVIRVLGVREVSPFQSLASDPSEPIEGQTYYNTTTHKARVWDGTSWNDLW